MCEAKLFNNLDFLWVQATLVDSIHIHIQAFMIINFIVSPLGFPNTCMYSHFGEDLEWGETCP